jgi:hypothetical protein
MSIATLKKKSQTQYKNMSVGMTGFSLNGTYRNQGYIGQTSLSRSLPRTLMKGNVAKGHGGCCGKYNLATIIRTPEMACLEDNSVVKSSVLNTKGMIKTKYRWITRPAPFTSVKPDTNNNLNKQSDYITNLASKTIECTQHTISTGESEGGTSYREVDSLFVNLVSEKPLWGMYSANAWSGNTLSDLTGNGRNAVGVGVSSGNGSGNGATASIPYLYGNTSSTITWPSGSVPTNFTICSITRYTGGINSRIFTGYESGFNWLHGHWSGNRGPTFYGAYFMSNNTSVGNLTDWLVCCGKNGSTSPNNILLDGVPSGIANGGSGGGTLTINNNTGGVSSEISDWAFSYVLIWDQVLTDEELVIVSNKLIDYLSNGISLESIIENGIPQPRATCKEIKNPDRIRKLKTACASITKPVEFYSPLSGDQYASTFKKKCSLNNTFFVPNNNKNVPFIRTT